LCFQDVVWEGQTAGVEAAVDFFKADKAFPLSEMKKVDLRFSFNMILIHHS
jgi:Xaa-Pro aminopeptidase